MNEEEFEAHCEELEKLAAARKPKRVRHRWPKWIRDIEERKYRFLVDTMIEREEKQLEEINHAFEGRGTA
jgi:hypothetical protein